MQGAILLPYSRCTPAARPTGWGGGGGRIKDPRMPRGEVWLARRGEGWRGQGPIGAAHAPPTCCTGLLGFKVLRFHGFRVLGF